MTASSRSSALAWCGLAITLAVASGCAAGTLDQRSGSTDDKRVTILVDAFGIRPDLHQDWGFAALVEYGGKRILFDTGNDSAGFVENAHRLGVDLKRLDAVVISHRHGDHTAGLRHVLRLNPQVKVFVPDDEAFGGPTPLSFFQRPEPSLPATMRYFNGAVPDVIPHGSAWQGVNFIRVDTTMEIAPGLRLVRNISSTERFSETPELSLVVDTPEGQVIIVGCSHPGIEQVVASVAAVDARIAMVLGGLHLVTTLRADIERSALALRNRWKIQRIAPGHCTGEIAFALLQEVFGKGYEYAGVGTVVDLS